ncbi:MAG: hypothetical protein WKF47_13155 [Geodermatophilaceae bacterium]
MGETWRLPRSRREVRRTCRWVAATTGKRACRIASAPASSRLPGVPPPGPRGLLPGLVAGDTSTMDPVLAEQFRRTGACPTWSRCRARPS